MLRIDLVDDRTEFVPGGEILGVASWDVVEPPERAELRLFWHTQGKGDTDVGIVETRTWPAPGVSAAESFRFDVPEGPYSYAGSLISIAWALELVVDGEKQVARIDLVVSPNGAPVHTRRSRA